MYSMPSGSFALPNIRTQKTMTKTLNISQQEITLLKQLAKQYRNQRHGLIKKLLTGEWHTKNQRII